MFKDLKYMKEFTMGCGIRPRMGSFQHMTSRERTATHPQPRQLWPGPPALTPQQGNMELPTCVQRRLLNGPELETSLQSELEGARKASGKSNQCEEGSRLEGKTLDTTEERLRTEHRKNGQSQLHWH